MRRLAAVATALVLTSAGMAPADAATARIGGPCKKLHQVDWIKGVRAQCTWLPAGQGKKGRALWKPLAPAKTTATAAELGVESPTPTPAPTLSASTTPEPWVALAAELQADMSRSLGDEEIDVRVSPNVDPAIAMRLRDVLVWTSALWTSHGVALPKPRHLRVFSELDKDWLASTLPTGTWIYECAAPYWFTDVLAMGLDGGQCRLPDGSFMSVVVFGTKARLSPEDFADLDVGVSHEYAHSIQLELTGRTFADLQQGTEPCWFVEGVPTMLGSFAARLMIDGKNGGIPALANSRRQGILDFVSDANRRSEQSGSTPVSNWTLAEWTELATAFPANGDRCRAIVQENGRPAEGSIVYFGYRIGAIITEKYVLERGLDGLIALMRGRRQAATFEAAFADARGVPMKTWISETAIPYVLEQCGATCASFLARAS